MALLDDLKDTFSATASQIGQVVGSGIVNKTTTVVEKLSGGGREVAGVQSSPVPSIPDAEAGGFFDSEIGGIAVPLLVAAGLALFLIMRKK